VDLPKNTTQLQKQITFFVWWVVGEGVGLVKSKHDERPSWPFRRVQEAVWVYGATESFSCLFHSLPVFIKVSIRATLGFPRDQFTAFHELEKNKIFSKLEKK
jgi:hypothetical protein